MNSQWISVEHYRMHCVELWPDSPYKEATLSGIRAAITRLSGGVPGTESQCDICIGRKREKSVIEIVRPAAMPLVPTNRAA